MDEAQFFAPSAASALRSIADGEIDVYVAGLLRDFEGRPWETVEAILPLARFFLDHLNRELAREFITSGFRAILVCIDPAQIDPAFCGREFDEPLLAALAPLGRVTALVPERERSAASHCLTLHKPLRVREHRHGVLSVNGTPADCSRLGVIHLLRKRCDLVVSGINRGANLGDDIMYSGTVAAAMEGLLSNIPSIAISIGGFGADLSAFVPPFVAQALRRARTILRRREEEV